MPAPVCVTCGRFFRPAKNGVSWEEMHSDGRRDGTERVASYRLWSGDLWACPECGARIIVGHGKMPLAEHFEAERVLFIALNRKIAVNANTMVKSWAGPSAAMIREANEKPGGSLQDRINFGSHAQRTFDASVVAKGLLIATTGILPSGPIERIMTRTDAGLKTNQSAEERAAGFLRLIGGVWSDEKTRTGNRVRLLPMIALGMVTHKRWLGKNATQPDVASLRRLKIANWDTVATVHARRFLPVFVKFIEDRWKGE